MIYIASYLHRSLIFIFLFVSCVKQDNTNELYQIFSDARQYELDTNPISATYAGNHKLNDRMPSVSNEQMDKNLNFLKSIILRLEMIQLNTLSKKDKINHKIFYRIVNSKIKSIEYKDYYMPFNADSGFHTGLARLYKAMPFKTVKNYQDYISRLLDFPRYFDEQISNMALGIKTGISIPKIVLEGYEVTIKTHVVDSYEESVFFEPFQSFPNSFTTEQQVAIRKQGQQAVMNGAVKAYASFLDFFLNQYYPNARKSLGASELPGGIDYYKFKIEHFTTLNLSAQEIHEIGLNEVSRIRNEMEAVIKSVNFKGSFSDFLNFLRTDPQFYATTSKDLLKEASYIAKRIDAKLPTLFNKLPRLPYGVAPVPEDLAPKYTGGRYVGPAEGSKEPGYYWVNTYKLDVRPLYNLEALTLHEGVPGHHLQNSIASEIDDLPEFRKDLYLSAFGEGWGLYSEYLGIEAGFYTDPYSNFGRLTYEMWRACRLVVDTGIHAMGWSRQRVINYLSDNTALPIHECTTETDRYIAWPGQALSYKIGELKIKELRKFAEKELGKEFDVRNFHDTVLGSGSVPLNVLEDQVKDWVASQKN
ncbi:MAG: DUF885 domain-containing protein [Candidatus Marinimicrobia bacterium]|jgi:uncharacterized protein (DUF885 family)|nr:DUF885 domain-containing protein [Candidatus Neomarinimicrobiota bacterium]MBT7423840.1 DUF885 domain-containing protein [Candidatus Neomarinimicrobiota bacterium]MDG2367033.1 DUF885 domain-containing protein [Candidatus Neomarinimicrobiota bacterium]|tara:strand:+ start:166 stop:1926 length:1761 start_codon:yes stop_codon:yes gene_type:complete